MEIQKLTKLVHNGYAYGYIDNAQISLRDRKGYVTLVTKDNAMIFKWLTEIFPFEIMDKDLLFSGEPFTVSLTSNMGLNYWNMWRTDKPNVNDYRKVYVGIVEYAAKMMGIDVVQTINKGIAIKSPIADSNYHKGMYYVKVDSTLLQVIYETALSKGVKMTTETAIQIEKILSCEYLDVVEVALVSIDRANNDNPELDFRSFFYKMGQLK